MLTIRDFIAELRTKSTKTTYRAGILSFLDWKYGRQRTERNATAEEMARYEALAAQYLHDKNDHASDLRLYAASMQEIPPKTAAIRMTGIKEYFLINDIELSEKDTRQIKSRMPKGGARTIERDLDNKVAQVILAHSDVKGKALILSLLSSGMRLGECLQLRFSDVNLEKSPAEITIRQEMTKTRHQRITFLSHEAVTALHEWLKVRQAYIDSAANRNAGLVASGVGSVRSKDDQRIFPFTSHVAQAMWRTTVKNAGLASIDESTNRHQYHYHQFRKFFRSQMALTCPIDIVEALLGHESYLASAYRRYTREQMAEYYLKSEHHITISLPSSEIGEFQTEIKKEMTDQQQSIAALVGQNRQLEQKLKTMESIVDALTEGRAVLKGN